MHCPICPTTTLVPIQLAPQLPAQGCPRCNGVWIASSDYWAWLEQPDAGASFRSEEAVQLGEEPSGARRCAGCGHIQLSYPIALDLTFRLDQCGNCNSFWLDRHEWEILRERGWHRRLHQITNTPWQRRLRREQSRAVWEQIYRERFGDADYAEIQRVRTWMRAHPQQAMLLTYLSSDDPYQP